MGNPTDNLEAAVNEIKETMDAILILAQGGEKIPKALYKALLTDGVWLIKTLREYMPDLAKLVVVGKEAEPKVLRYLQDLVNKDERLLIDPVISSVANSGEMIQKAKMLLQRCLQSEIT